MAHASDPHSPITIRGLVTAQGRAVVHARVEVWDLHGTKIATGFTNSTGSFVITTAAAPGEYVLLVEIGSDVKDQRFRFDKSDREVNTAFPSAGGSPATLQAMCTISALELAVPAKAREHLSLAEREFGRLNFDGAEKEIGWALQIDSTFAAAFSMRALLRLASHDPNGAILDAMQALALDPGEAGAYVALATAHNVLHEYSMAEAAAQRALEMRPDFWQGRLELAKALYGEGRLIPALHELDELDKDFPDVHLVRANVLMRLDRIDGATREFSEFLQESPNDSRREEVQQIVIRAADKSVPDASRK